METTDRTIDDGAERRSRRRPLASMGVAALVLTLLPGTALADQHDVVEPRGTDRVCPAPDPDDDAPQPEDVAGTTHEETVTCALEYGLVQGFEDGSYRPGNAVTRGQMATFVANWVTQATGVAFEDVEEDAFPDIAGSTHAEAINGLADTGVVVGRADGTFGPDATITRGQMAAFVAGALDLADSLAVDGSLPPADDTAYFEDAVDTTFEAEIQALAGAGIVQGVGEDTYAPDAEVTRGQLATFLMSAADLLDRRQRWEPTAVIVTYEVDLSGENEVDGDTGEFGAGQPDATGHATVTVDAFLGQLTVVLDYTEVDGPFGEAPGAHIHAGAIDENGPIVVGFASGEDLDDGDGTLTSTVTEDPETFRFAELVEDPDAFYVNVHSDDFPAGAVRGQLPDGGQDLLEPASFEVTMTGENELDTSGDEVVTGVGQLGSTAMADLEVDYVGGEIRYELDLTDVTGPFDEAPGFHVHVGSSTENGPIVAFLADGAAVAAAQDSGTLTGTFEGAPPSVLRAIVTDPSGYYLNLHSNEFPAGAVRGQLG